MADGGTQRRDAPGMDKPSERADGSNVIYVDFTRGRAVDPWFLRMAERCEAQAEKATPRVAASLKRLAGAYRDKASG